MINDVFLTPLSIIDTPGGNVMHAMKKVEDGFSGFGEAYFSMVEFNAIKAWKRHKDMTLNLIVPVGEIKFVLYDNTHNQNTQFNEFTLSRENYCRLTVPPMVWVGFKGLSEAGSMLLNIANLEHNPLEVDRKNIDEIIFNWDN
jgi:dTDP-4-dehydrorhamnose 3,5-epimerase